MIAPAIPLTWVLFLWHGPIYWGTGYFPSSQMCEEIKQEFLLDPFSMVTDAECVK